MSPLNRPPCPALPRTHAHTHARAGRRSEYGESFRIVDRAKFAQDVLPLYFKHAHPLDHGRTRTYEHAPPRRTHLARERAAAF